MAVREGRRFKDQTASRHSNLGRDQLKWGFHGVMIRHATLGSIQSVTSVVVVVVAAAAVCICICIPPFSSLTPIMLACR